MRVGKWLRWFALMVTVILIAIVALLLTLDIATYRKQLESAASEALGRTVTIAGDMALGISLRPSIELNGLHIANPDWASRPYLAQIGRLKLKLSLLPLIRGELEIAQIHIDGADIQLEENTDGEDNWTFGEEEEEAAVEETEQPIWLPGIEELLVRQARLGYRPADAEPMELTIADAKGMGVSGKPIKVEIAAAFREVPFTLTLVGGSPGELSSTTQPWPIQMALQVPEGSLKADAVLHKPLVSTLELRVALEGQRLHALAPLLGTELPESGPYALSATLVSHDGGVELSELKGSIDDFDRWKRIVVDEGGLSVFDHEPVTVNLTGSIDTAPFAARFSGGTLTQLQDSQADWPLRLHLQAADASMQVDGLLQKPLLGGTQLAIAVQGQRLDALSPFAGTELPTSGPYAMSAQLKTTEVGIELANLSASIHEIDRWKKIIVDRGGVSASQHQPVVVTLAGHVDEAPFMITVYGGSLAQLEHTETEWPVRLELQAADASFKLNGALHKPLYSGAALEFTFQGQRLNTLSPFAGTDLPPSGPYAMSAQLKTTAEGAELVNLTGTIHDLDPIKKLVIERGSLAATEHEPLALRLEGRVNKIPFATTASSGTVTQLQTPGKEVPLRFSAELGKLALKLEGTVNPLAETKQLDVGVTVKGTGLNELNAVLGPVLPRLRPFQVSARTRYTGAVLTVSELKTRMGRARISGDLSWDGGGPRPRLSGTLRSTGLDPQIFQAPPKRAAKKQAPQPAVLDQPLALEGLKALDVDLRLDSRRLRLRPVTIDRLQGAVILIDGKLRLEGVRAALAGTRLTGFLQLHEQNRWPRLVANVKTGRVELGKLLDALEVEHALSGSVDSLSVNLSASGKTLGALLARADIKLDVGPVGLVLPQDGNDEALKLALKRTSLRVPRGKPMEVRTDGTFRQVPFKIRVTADTLPRLIQAPTRARIAGLSVAAAETELQAKGTPLRSEDGARYQVSFSIKGKGLQTLGPLLEAELPPIGPYTINGSLKTEPDLIRLADLQLNVGSTDVTGEVSYANKPPRPKLTARLVSKRVDINDFKGAESAPEPEPRPQEPQEGIPDIQIPVAALRQTDADLQYRAKQIYAGPIDMGDLDVKVVLDRGHLVIAPFGGHLASGGYVSGLLDLDARKDVPSVVAKLTAEKLNYGALLDRLVVTEKVAGEGDLRIDLAGDGVSLESILSTANGRLEFISGPATVDIQPFFVTVNVEDVITTMFQGLLPQKQKGVLNCMVTRWNLKEGVASSDELLMDTDKFTIAASGVINFDTEEIDVVIRPKANQRRLLDVATPIQITGTLSKPLILPQRLPTIDILGGFAVDLGNPRGLVDTIDTLGDTGLENPCVVAIEKRDQRELRKKRGWLYKIKQKLRGIVGKQEDATENATE